MTALKTCFKCKTEKPRSEFYAHPAMADGLLGKCKACTRRDVQGNYRANVERYRAYDAERNSDPQRKARAIESFRISSKRNPERTKVNRIVSNALRDGLLLRNPCWVCGEHAEAHHPDYSQPLDIVWLCKSHHRQAHMLLRKID